MKICPEEKSFYKYPQIFKQDIIFGLVPETIYIWKTYLGISVSRFHAENLVIPGVEISPLYLAWFGLAKVEANPALLPRRLTALVEGVRVLMLESVAPYLKKPSLQIFQCLHINYNLVIPK